MKKQVLFGLMMSLSLLATACARDTVDSSTIAGGSWKNGVQTNNIDREYTLTYSESEGRSSLLATFLARDTWNTTVRLVAPSKIVVNGVQGQDKELMSKESAVTLGILLPIFSPFFYLSTGTNYHVGLGGAQSAHIEWTDQLGHLIVDDLQVYPAHAYVSSTTVSRSGGFTVQVAATSASSDDDFVVSISQENPSVYVSARSYSGASSVTFDSTDLAKLHSGPAKMQLERRVTRSVIGPGDNKARLSSVYQASPQYLTVW